MTVSELLALSDSGTIGVRVRWGNGEETAVWLDADEAAETVVGLKEVARARAIEARIAAEIAALIGPTESELVENAESLIDQLKTAQERLEAKGAKSAGEDVRAKIAALAALEE